MKNNLFPKKNHDDIFSLDSIIDKKWLNNMDGRHLTKKINVFDIIWTILFFVFVFVAPFNHHQYRSINLGWLIDWLPEKIPYFFLFCSHHRWGRKKRKKSYRAYILHSNQRIGEENLIRFGPLIYIECTKKFSIDRSMNQFYFVSFFLIDMLVTWNLISIMHYTCKNTHIKGGGGGKLFSILVHYYTIIQLDFFWHSYIYDWMITMAISLNCFFFSISIPDFLLLFDLQSIER